MRLHASLVQALPPSEVRLRLAQLPGFEPEEISQESPASLSEFVNALEKKHDGRIPEVKKAFEQWGKVQIISAAFKVIGDRFITPSSIVFLVVKLRLVPAGIAASNQNPIELDTKAQVDRENEFLRSRNDAEDLPEGAASGWAHAPYWPAVCTPQSLRHAFSF